MEWLSGISKRGDRYIRRLLVHGARAIVGWSKRLSRSATPWIERMLERPPVNVVTVAYANKLAQIVMSQGTRFNPLRAFAPAA
jgi:transposase